MWGERLKVALPVRVRAAEVVGTGLVINFSVSGAFIATSVPVSLFSKVRVTFVLKGPAWRRVTQLGPSFEAQVVRHNAAGFAVEWFEFGAEEVVAIANSNRRGTPVTQRPTAVRDSDLARWNRS